MQITNFKIFQFFKTHKKRVTSIYSLSNKKLVSTSYYDSTIKFYNLKKYILEKSLKVECIGLYNTLIELNNDYICLTRNKKAFFN